MIDVAVGVISRSDGRILIAKRPHRLHMGGLWEFPGGKVEAGEKSRAALVRELREEIAIEIGAAVPLLRVRYDDPTQSVRLLVFRVTEWCGEPRACERQEIKWVAVEDLNGFEFPRANDSIRTVLLNSDSHTRSQ